MPKHKGLQGTAWANCDRCGFVHPIGQLQRQKGLLLCKDHGCVDDLTVERRPIIIAQVLSDGREGVNDRETLYEQDPQDLEF